MIAEIHNLQLPSICQLLRSAPNILCSVGNSLLNQSLQINKFKTTATFMKTILRSLLEGLELNGSPDACSRGIEPISRAGSLKGWLPGIG